MQAVDWQVIVKQHGPIVWQTAYRLLGNYADTADCFQETFISALKVSRRQSVRNFSALLIRLATARAIDQLRQRTREGSRFAGSQANINRDFADFVTVPSNEAEPSENIQAQELVIGLRKALGQLPPLEAQAFCLRYLNNMSYRSMAKELGIKTTTAGVLLHRARVKLRTALSGLEKAAVM